MNPQFFRLRSGRTIAFDEHGDPNGQPVFYFHGTPGSRLEARFGDEAGKRYGFRLIAPDRPGMGRSDPHNGRSLLDYTNDVVALADHLSFKTFGILGASSGGPPALACAYAIPERLRFVAIMASPAPITDAAAFESMNATDRFLARISQTAPGLYPFPFALMRLSVKLLPAVLLKAMLSKLIEVDRASFSDPQSSTLLVEDVREAFRQGARGPSEDILLGYRDWGFRVEDITIPVDIYHGTTDDIVPFVLGERLATAIPGATLHPYPDFGHTFILTLFSEILCTVAKGQIMP